MLWCLFCTGMSGAGRAKCLSSLQCSETSQRTIPLLLLVSYGLDNVPSTAPQALCALRLREGREGGLWLQHSFSFFSFATILMSTANADLSIWRRNKCLHCLLCIDVITHSGGQGHIALCSSCGSRAEGFWGQDCHCSERCHCCGSGPDG